MAKIYAICPYCKVNITLSDKDFSPCLCPSCSGFINSKLLEEKDAYIDNIMANAEFTKGKEYFDDGNYHMALKTFRKALDYNSNHYLAYYHSSLCEIYSINSFLDNSEYSKRILEILVNSIVKVNLSCVDDDAKSSFLLLLYYDVYKMLQKEFSGFLKIYEDAADLNEYRTNCFALATGVKFLLETNRKYFMLDNEECLAILSHIVDLGINACMKCCYTKLYRDLYVDIIDDTMFDSIKKIYTELLKFMKSINKDYDPESHKQDYSQAKENNDDIFKFIHILKNYAKNYSSPTFVVSAEIPTVLKDRMDASIKYTSQVIKNNLLNFGDTLSEAELIADAFHINIELISPLFYPSSSGKIIVEGNKLQRTKNLVDTLKLFYNTMPLETHNENLKIISHKCLKIVNHLKQHYDNVTKTYDKDYLKNKSKLKKEFVYYKKFLYNMVLASSIALSSLLGEFDVKATDRIKMLKLGKSCAEKFFSLHDFNFGNIKSNPEYADIIPLYNVILEEIGEDKDNHNLGE